MADNTVQFGITVDISTVSTSLSRVTSIFQDTTNTVSMQWTETSSTVTDSLKRVADEAENTAGRTKEQIEKASGAVDLLGDAIGIKVPGELQKLLASSSLIGPVLEAAFAPLAAIAFVGVVQQVIGKLGELYDRYVSLESVKAQWESVNESLMQADHKVIEQMQQDYVEYVRTTQGQSKALRAEIAGAGIESIDVFNQLAAIAKDKTGKEFKDLSAGLKADMAQLQSFPAYELNDKIEMLAGAMKRAQENAARLRETKGVDSNDVQVAEGELHVLYRIDNVLKSIRDERAERAKTLGAQADRAGAQEAEEAARKKAASFSQELDDELTLLKQNHAVSVEEELHFWQSKLAAASKYPDVYRTIQKTIAAIDQQIFKQRDAAAQQAAQSREEANQRANAAILNDAKAQNDAIIAKGKELLDAQAALYKADIDNAQVNEQIKVQLAEADLAKGKINKKQEVQNVAAAKREEIGLEIQAWQAIESLYDREPKKVAEIEAKISKLKAQARLADAKAIADEAKATEATYKQLWSSIGNTFKSTLDGIIQGHETAAQAMQKLLSGLLQDIANYFEQKAMKEAAALVTSLVHTKTEAAGAIGAAAGRSFASAFADMASLGPEGLAAAPGAAAAASSTTMSGGLALLNASLDVGTWKVPFDMPAMVHSGEMVVPRFESDLFRNAVRSGTQGGGITVVVNHSVSAIDAQSFQGTIRRNSNMIANEIARALRKKSLAIS